MKRSMVRCEEMFLIFQLHRHGGIPFGDVAIQSAMKLIYNIVPPADVTAKNEDGRSMIGLSRIILISNGTASNIFFKSISYTV